MLGVLEVVRGAPGGGHIQSSSGSAKKHTTADKTHLALERSRSEQLRGRVCRIRFQHGDCGCPCLLLRPSRQPTLPLILLMPNLPISGTVPRTDVPALSARDWRPTAWCCAPPSQGQTPAGLRWRPW